MATVTLRNFFIHSVVATSLAATIGCNDPLPERVPVSGRVTIDGQPVSFGNIRFAPAAGGRVAMSHISADGGFQLTTYKSGDGCTLGQHAVTVSSFKDLSDTIRHWHVPKKYSQLATSSLEVKIDGPSDLLHLELTWDGKKGPVVEQRDE
jgi:hypothetical protein